MGNMPTNIHLLCFSALHTHLNAFDDVISYEKLLPLTEFYL